jgi:hypothetical protein
MSIITRRRLCTVAVLLTMPLTACAQSHGNTTAEPPIDLDSTSSGYPLDAYKLGEQQQKLSRQAFYTAAGKCVRRFGLTLPDIGTNPGRPPRPDRYGLTDEDTARTRGYSLDRTEQSVVSWEVQIPPGSQLFAVYNGMTAEKKPAAVPGLPEGGCQGEAERALTEGGAARSGADPIADMERQALRRSRQDSRVATATQAWRTCMLRTGRSYEDPVEAPYMYWSQQRVQSHRQPSAEEKAHGIAPSKEEVSVALADVRCKQETGLLRTWVAADIAYQKVLVAENSARLSQYRAAVEHETHNVRQLLAGG